MNILNMNILNNNSNCNDDNSNQNLCRYFDERDNMSEKSEHLQLAICCKFIK